MTFLHTLHDHARLRADQVALEFLPDNRPPEVLTYARLEEDVRRVQAYLLSLGIQPGDRVALQLVKGLPFIYLHLAVLRLGAISLPLNPA